MSGDANLAVELEQIGLAYQTWGNRVDALSDINLCIPTGSWVVISGDNGSGKSSLLRVIAGLSRPTSGTVRLFDKQLVKLPAGRRAALLAYVRQQPDQGLAPSLTIQEHVIGYGYDTLRFRERLAEFRLDDAFPFLIEAWPRPIETLSGGERQILGIVLQLIRATPLLLLDEAFSALDPAREGRVLNALDLMRTRRTIIQVTHQPDLLHDRADIEIRLRHGRIVEQGEFANAG